MIRNYRVFVGLNQIDKSDRYTAVVVDIAKSTTDNQIMKVAIGAKAVRKNISFDELVAFHGIVSSIPKKKTDYTVSSVRGFTSESILFGYNNKHDHRLVSQYVSIFPKINRIGGTLQTIEGGGGFYITSPEGGGYKYIIDIGSIEIPTLATMIAIDVVLQNRVEALLNALKD